MPTTKIELNGWFYEGIQQGASHMIVVCDTFDYEDFPVYVAPDEDVNEELKRRWDEPMQRVMEVYVLDPARRTEQLSETQAWHLEPYVPHPGPPEPCRGRCPTPKVVLRHAHYFRRAPAMGKSVTVKSGFSSVRGPSPKGYKSYNAGSTIVYTDAEYAALSQADLRVLSSPATNVADPDRPATDATSLPVSKNTAATGTVALNVGVNALTLTGNVTLTFPTGVAGGNESSVEVYLTQDGTGSRTLTLPASAKKAGGTAVTLTTAAGSVDYLEFKTVDGGTTWRLTNKQLDIK